MENDIILSLYNRPETVFSIEEIAQLSPNISNKHLRDRLYHAVKTGKLKRLRQGIYAKESYNPLELATKIYTPAYISLETVLSKNGLIFQHYDTIFAVSYLTRTVKVAGFTIQLRKINDSMLTNSKGINHETGYYIASTERAFLDSVYIYKNYHFDNLKINWDKVEEFKTIYKNAALNKRVNDYYKIFKEEHGKH